jgi:hypothetical protein
VQFPKGQVEIEFEEPKKALYRGNWARDRFDTSFDDRAWMLVGVDRLYYGQVNGEGQREGEGILFQPKVQEGNRELWNAYQNGTKYVTDSDGDGIVDDGKHRLLSYEGNWAKDMPHKFGTQYMEDGVYEGDFKRGKRHGRGKWTTLRCYKSL